MLPKEFKINPLRQQFPALQKQDSQGRPYVFFDGPGGTQVPNQVIETMQTYLTTSNANGHGHFITSQQSDNLLTAAREAMADFLNAPSPHEIVFGPNMTSLTFNISRVLSRIIKPGDEIIVTRLDHDANIAPWMTLAEQGVTIHQVEFSTDDCRLNIDQLASFLNERTKLVAVGYASNAVGTINPIKRIADMVQHYGAWLWVDAVHYAPHGPIDVQTLGCDFLVCSAYKFFGPHVGVLWGRAKLLEKLPVYKVRPASNEVPYKFEQGTQNHEGICGVTAAIDYLAEIGAIYGKPFAAQLKHYPQGRRRHLKQAMYAIADYERALFRLMVQGLQTIPTLTLYGLTNPTEFNERCPTLAFTHAEKTPAEIAAYLGEQSIFVWDGDYYAVNVMEDLGLADTGGAVRVGLAHYNTQAEVDRLISALKQL